MKIGPNQERWLTALETTELPQGRNRLWSPNGYCCLGIACVVFGDSRPVGLGLEDHPHVVEALALLNHKGDATNGISDEALDRMNQLGIEYPGLTSLNDDDELTFRQIASIVREFPELYFEEPR